MQENELPDIPSEKQGPRSASRPKTRPSGRVHAESIAIVGMSCRFPGADDYKAFWNNLAAGISSIVEIPPHRWDVDDYYSPDFSAPNKSITRWIGAVHGEDLFDNRFFNISPREARATDPQQRLLLEETWRCIEDAGLDPALLRESPTAVFVGVMSRDHLQDSWGADVTTDSYAALGGYDCILANRISYFFGLRGPSVSIDAACASSLVATHKAKQSLITGECTWALAAGVSLNLHAFKHISFSKSRMFSPDGRCKTFDKDADGYVPGDGIGVILMCLYEHALKTGCHIHGIVRGTAVNHVGHAVSLTAPSLGAQREVILAAYANAGMTPDMVTYTEAHGTGTSLGDPIEVEALTKAFRTATKDRGYCGIGSVKTNIGHLEASAGVAGVIKVLMMMKHRWIPRTLNVKTVNPLIRFEESPFKLALEESEWKPRKDGQPLRAGVSSFGFGGVNSHVVLEEYRPGPTPKHHVPHSHHLFLVSAKSDVSLRGILAQWQTFIKDLPDDALTLTQISATLAVGRQSFNYRLGTHFTRKEELVQWLAQDHPVIEKPINPRFGWAVDLPQPEVLPHFLAAFLRVPTFADRLKAIIKELHAPELAPLKQGQVPVAIQEAARFVVGYTLTEVLALVGLAPSLLIPRGSGIFVVLAARRMVPAKMALALYLNRGPAHPSFRRPVDPILDPVTQQVIWPYVFGVEYLRALVGPFDVEETDIAYYVDKAQILAHNQFTFKKFLEEWDAVLIRCGISCADLMRNHGLTADPGRERLLLLVVIHNCLARLNRKWNLEAENRIKAQGFRELVELVSEGWLGLADATDLILSEAPDLEGIAQRLNDARTRLSFDLPLPLLQQINSHLDEISDTTTWLAQCTHIHALQPPVGLPVFDALTPPPPETDAVLNMLLCLWEAGLPVNWQVIWPNGHFQRLALPTYVFDRRSFRLSKNKPETPVPTTHDSQIMSLIEKYSSGKIDYGQFVAMVTGKPDQLPASTEANRPVLENPLKRDPSNRNKFVRVVSPADLIIKDTVVLEQFIVPSTLRLEMALETARLISGRPIDTYRKLMFMTAGVVQGDYPIEVEIQPDQNRFSVTWEGLSLCQGQYAAEPMIPENRPELATPPTGTFTPCEEVYRHYVSWGYSYGPTLQLIRKVWETEDAFIFFLEAVPIDEGKRTGLDPHLLDCVFQSIFWAANRMDDRLLRDGFLYVPFTVESLHIFETYETSGYVVIRKSEFQVLRNLDVLLDYRVYDLHGNERVRIQRMLFKRAGRNFVESGMKPANPAKAAPAAQASPAIGSFNELVQELETFAASRREELLRLEFAMGEVERYGRLLLLKVFQELGLFTKAGVTHRRDEVKAHLRVIPKYERLFAALMDLLHRHGFLTVGGDQQELLTTTPAVTAPETVAAHATLDGFRVAIAAGEPDMEPFLNLLTTAVTNYGSVLSGEKTHLEVLFPKGSGALFERIYKENALSDFYNALVTRAICGYTQIRAKINQPVRILEIGAGTGGTSAMVLPALDALGLPIEYWYTDISLGFTNFGKRAYGGGRPYMQFKALDVEKDLIAQGFEPNTFDIVFETNCVHATRILDISTREMKKLLRTDGLLIINEISQLQDFWTFVAGLIDGWWLFEDQGRIEHSPLLSHSGWAGLFQRHGFYQTHGVDAARTNKRYEQAVVLALSDGQLQLTAQEQATLAQRFAKTAVAPTAPVAAGAATPSPASTAASATALSERMIAHLATVFAETLQMEARDFSAEGDFSEYGIDSMIVLDLIDKLERHFGELPKTLMFEHMNLRSLAGYFVREFRTATEALCGGSEIAAPTPTSAQTAPVATTSTPVALSTTPALPLALLSDPMEADLAERMPALLALEAAMTQVETYGHYLLLETFQKAGLLKTPGQRFTQDQFRSDLKLIPKYTRLFAALIEMLTRVGFLAEEGNQLVVTAKVNSPETRAILVGLESTALRIQSQVEDMTPFVNLLSTAIRQYPALLRGELTHLEVLFPKGSGALFERIYKENRLSDHYNLLVTRAITAFVEGVQKAQPGRKVRVLEVGSGTGGTSAGVMKALQPYAPGIEFFYTDISLGFANFGKRTWGQQYPFAQFKVLDIEKDPIAQGFDAQGYDLIFETNCIHATRDLDITCRHLKRLLQPNGVLIINEISRLQDFWTFVAGLIDGWWLFEDTYRILHTPLLSHEGWRRLFEKHGFYQAYGPDGLRNKTYEQAVVLAFSDGKVDLAAVAVAQPAVAATTTAAAPTASRTEQKLQATCQGLRVIFADVLQMNVNEFRDESDFSEYGIDSMVSLEIISRLEAVFGELPKTLMFEHMSIKSLAGYLLANNAETCAQAYPVAAEAAPLAPTPAASTPISATTPATATTFVAAQAAPAAVTSSPMAPPAQQANPTGPGATQPTPVREMAIIGVAARFPQSPNYRDLWRHLAAGTHLVREVPTDRWDWQPLFDTEKGNPGKVYTRWGGFLEDVDRFDPLFFKIAPKAAELMDPQQRVFLETAWAALEDAGYTRKTLGSEVGVFVGVTTNTYGYHGVEQTLRGNPQAPDVDCYDIANRVSYHLDLNGPSMAIDTACSSSLTAVHLACASIRRGECSTALAGGVSLTLHPSRIQQFCAKTMLSASDRSRTFGEGADGFVDAEGAGAILIKPLDQARADGDFIYALIKGSSINAGGRTSGYTVPNPNAQGRLVAKAMENAGIRPETVSYIEAHGTGTSLGDPIEISGLKQAFGPGLAPGSVGLGSIKTNIGHTIAAAGIAGLIKVILQLQHRVLVPSLHAETPNKLIDFASTPFRIQTRLEDWNRPRTPSGEAPLRAGISSFGAGGSNAHVILEEAPDQLSAPETAASELVILSARSLDRLQEAAKNLLAFVTRSLDEDNLRLLGREVRAELGQPVLLRDLAHTLRIGREAMPTRLTILVQTKQELAARLADFVEGRPHPDLQMADLSDRKTAKFAIIDDEDGRTYIETLIRKGKLRQIAGLWADGIEVDWGVLSRPDARRIPLPTYPFLRERYWLPETTANTRPQEAASLHPLLHRNTSTLAEQRFTSVFPAHHPLFQDHQIDGTQLLPGAAYLEMARMAGACSLEKPVHHLRGIVWSRPYDSSKAGQNLYVGIRPTDSCLNFEAYSQDAQGNRAIHAEGGILTAAVATPAPRPIEACRRNAVRHLNRSEVYTLFRNGGMVYGPSMQAIQSLALHHHEAVAQLHVGKTLEGCLLDPALVDGALQVAVQLKYHRDGRQLPFKALGLDEVLIHTDTLPNTLMVHAIAQRQQMALGHESSLEKFDLYLTDPSGQVLVSLLGFSARTGGSNPHRITDSGQPTATHYIEESWTPASPSAWPAAPIEGPVMVLGSPQHRDTICSHFDGRLTFVETGPHTQVRQAPWGLHAHIRLDHPQAWSQLIAELQSAGQLPRSVVFAWSLDRHSDTAHNLARGPFAVLALFQAIRRIQPGGNLHIVVAHPLSANQVIPEWAALRGLARTLHLENPQTRLHTVAVDDRLLERTDWVSRLLGTFQESTIASALLPDQRLICVRRAFTPTPVSAPSRLRHQGVYLLTGGTGGIGFRFAADLAKRFAARLVLAGRRPEDDSIRAALSELAQLGGQAIYLQADVSNRAAVDNLLSRAQAHFGTLHGIIHAAGLNSDSFVLRKTPEDLDRVFAPKIWGTINLDDASAHLPLDFFMVFSSLAALIGNTGQADYTYANSFIDHYIRHRARRSRQGQRHGMSLAINWPLWQGGGMAIEEHTLDMFARVWGMVGLPPSTGINAFETGLSLERNCFGIVHGHTETILSAFQDTLPSRHAAEPPLRTQRETPAAPTAANTPSQAPVQTQATPPTSAAPASADLDTSVRSILTDMLAQETGLTPSRIKGFETFEAYGIDSVMVFNLNRKLEAQFGNLSKTLLFEHQTLDALAEYLLTHHRAALQVKLQPTQAQPVTAQPVEPERPKTPAPAEPPTRRFSAAQQLPSTTSAQPISPAPLSPAAEVNLEQALRQLLTELISGETGVALAQIRPQTALEAYGLDSIMVFNLNRKLEAKLGTLSKTLLFEHGTIEELTQYLLDAHQDQVRARLTPAPLILPPEAPSVVIPPPAPQTAVVPQPTVAAAPLSTRFIQPVNPGPVPPVSQEPRPIQQTSFQPRHQPALSQSEPIAIIGLAGQFPQAPDLDRFWENLKQGRDCITEIPPSRWDADSFFNPDKNNVGTSYSKWGGFLEDIDRFDARFFNISPREAELTDPQERLFLETAWKTFENAGYTRTSLRNNKVGVFVGVMWGEYQLYGAEQTLLGQPVSLSASYASIANRVSYFFDFHGPAMALDTMCSSSLTALHLACQSIRTGECTLALAGGVNLSVHPNKYLYLSQGKFAASDGRCKGFGEGGDGYVPGEGVGAVLLKPLSAALADGDAVFAIIRGSALNHGGKTNGYTVPNPKAQGDLIAEALQQSGITPDQLGYLEAHGTGTSLGDPIEIAGLNRALAPYRLPAGTIPMGTVKSNVGHLESAAGMAGLFKIILQMQHQQLVPSIHTQTLNPNIDFSATPFRVQSHLTDWSLRPGQHNRKAGLSSFGAGGSNAHLIIEEAPSRPATAASTEPVLIILSSRSEAQLNQQAQQLADWLTRHLVHDPSATPAPDPNLQQELVTWVAQTKEVSPADISIDEPFQDMGMEQMEFVQLSRWIAERYACHLTTADFVIYPNIQTLATFLHSIQPQTTSPASSACTIDLRNLAFTLQTGREAMPYRLALITADASHLITSLKAFAQGQRAGFVWGHAPEPQDNPVPMHTLSQIAQRWVQGAEPTWTDLYQSHPAQRLPAPGYVFDRKRYWVNIQPRTTAPARTSAQPKPTALSAPAAPLPKGTFQFTRSWEADLGPALPAQLPNHIFMLAHDDFWMAPLQELLGNHSVIWLKPAATYAHRRKYIFELNLDAPEDLDRLVIALPAARRPTHLIHILPQGTFSADPSAVETDLRNGVSVVFHFARALLHREPQARLNILSAHFGSEPHPSHEALAACLRALAAEHSGLAGRLLTLDNDLHQPATAKTLLAELLDPRPAAWIQLRQGQRLAPQWRHQPLPAAQPLALKNQGVYLLTGGLGGLGTVFARHLLQKPIHLLLTGRRPLEGELAETLQNLGERAAYFQADLSRPADVQRLVAHIESRYSTLDGIIHSAGVLRDGLIGKKSAEDLKLVLAPKVWGTVHLDRATRHFPLSFFVTFSSMAALLPTAGQSDYAYANAFQDSYMAWRAGQGAPGQSLTLNWPLWRDGGMHLDAAGEQLVFQRFGMVPLETADGLKALNLGLTNASTYFVVAAGDATRLEHSLNPHLATPQPTAINPATAPASEDLLQDLSLMVRKVLRMTDETIEFDSDLSSFGFDSITFSELASLVNQQFGLSVAPTLFYEYASLAELARFIQTHAAPQPAAVSATASLSETPATPATFAGAAVIGMAARMPESPNLETFWRHLAAGDDLMREIPADRWDWRAWFGDPDTDENRTHIKWGSFLSDIDLFDPAHFGISRTEALLMDPQQRLFLQLTWNTFEHAGYAPASFSGTRCGVYIGVGTSDYHELLSGTSIEAHSLTGKVHSILPNRISYLFNLRGPSEPIDTACSSSLVAVDRALKALESGECDTALAGGILLLINPETYVAISKAGMLAEDGRCKTFDTRANGYARGEGAGAILLKPLNQALADGDTIWAVIRGSAVNHGGKSPSLTAPNPRAQAEVVTAAWEKARVSPASAGYIEAHGTGTSLGDPIEVNGLKLALDALYQKWNLPKPTAPTCGIGSVKTNIGHLEVAAGIAGLLKLILALHHQQRPASLHLQTQNPFVDLSNSPFRIITQTEPWEAPSSGEPRRAGISSFGFGGVNAHVVLEEFTPKPRPSDTAQGPFLFLLSARTETLLHTQVQELHRWLAQQTELDLAAVAYTLQVGRNALDERLALITNTTQELISELQAWCEGRPSACLRGRRKPQTVDKPIVPNPSQHGLAGYLALTQAWLQGTTVHWSALYKNKRPQRLPLPTYVFAQERFWLPQLPTPQNRSGHVDLPASLGFSEVHFSAQHVLQHFQVTDHKVNGQPVLPAVAYIELVRASAATVLGRPVTHMRDLVWMAPYVLDRDAEALQLSFERDGSDLRFSVQSQRSGKRLEHAQGKVGLEAPSNTAEPEQPTATFSETWTGEDCYQRLQSMNLVYGPAYRALQQLHRGDGVAMAELAGQPDLGFLLHPALLDGALQSPLGLAHAKEREAGRAWIPFALDHLRIYGKVLDACTAWVQGEHGLEAPLTLQLRNATGQLLVHMEGLSYRATQAPGSQPARLLTLAPSWSPITLPTATPQPALRLGATELAGTEAIPSDKDLAKTLAASDHRRLIVTRFLEGDAAATEVLQTAIHICKAAMKSRKAHFQLAFLIPNPDTQPRPAFMALDGFLRTLSAERPLWSVRLIAHSPHATSTDSLFAHPAPYLFVRYSQGRWQHRELAPLPVPRVTPNLPSGGVCLLTGGTGALAQIIARALHQNHNQRVVLLGRSAQGPAGFPYLQADVTDLPALTRAFEKVQAEQGPIHAVFHCAGVLADGVIANLHWDNAKQTLPPKVSGTYHLHQLARAHHIRHLVLFSSAAALVGNPGQAAYAYANSYMDAFAHAYDQPETRVHTLNWPFWAEGGMKTDPDRIEANFQRTGIQPLQNQEGIDALLQCLASGTRQWMPLVGDRDKILRFLSGTSDLETKPVAKTAPVSEPQRTQAAPQPQAAKTEPPVPPAPPQPTTPTSPASTSNLHPGAHAYLAQIISSITQTPAAQMEPDRPLTEYGVDSFMTLKVIKTLEKTFGRLSKTLLFDHDTLAALTDYLIANHAAKLQTLPEIAATLNQAPPTPPPAQPPSKAPDAPATKGPMATTVSTTAALKTAAAKTTAAPPSATQTAPAAPAREAARLFLAEVIAQATQTPAEAFQDDVPFSEYGVDSFLTLKVIKNLEKRLGRLSKTLLFDHDTLGALTTWALAHHSETLGRLIAPTPEPVPQPLTSQPATPTRSITQPDATATSQTSTTQPAEPQTTGPDFFVPLVILERDLPLVPDLQAVVQPLFEAYRSEGSVSRGTRNIAPYLFLGSRRAGFFNFHHNGEIAMVYAYSGPESNFEPLLEQMIAYCNREGWQFNMLSEVLLTRAGQFALTAHPFGAVQRVHDLPSFSLDGGSMRRLRYLVQKFEKLGTCTTREIDLPRDPVAQKEILRVLDQWCSTKTKVNPLIRSVRAELVAGTLGAKHRIFATYLDDVLQNAIVISSLAGNRGYLMDLEFYPPDMPLGGLEFGIVQMIKILVAEGASLLSLGGTFGPAIGVEDHGDPAVLAELAKLRDQGIFQGEGNFQFKNKFRTENTPVYLLRQPGTDPATVLDVIMMVADPQEVETPSPETPQATPAQEALHDLQPEAQPDWETMVPAPIGQFGRTLLTYGFNPLLVPLEEVPINLLTDSWGQLDFPALNQRMAALGAQSGPTEDPAALLAQIFGTPHVLVVGSGRMAEQFYANTLPQGIKVAQNLLFLTWLFHQANRGIVARECPHPSALVSGGDHLFKGDVDLERLEQLLSQEEQLGLICVECCANASGGYPLSLANLRAVRQLADRHQLTLCLDTTRILENALFIQRHEPGYQHMDPWQITRELADQAHIITSSLAKDFGLSLGGFIGIRDLDLYQDLKETIAAAGGGLNVQTQRLIARALSDRETVLHLVQTRVAQVADLHRRLTDVGVPLLQPAGAHALFLDVQHLPAFAQRELAQQECITWIYAHTGIRVGKHSPALQQGTLLNGLLRLCIPVGFDTATLEDIARRLIHLFQSSPAPMRLRLDKKQAGAMGESKARFRVLSPLVEGTEEAVGSALIGDNTPSLSLKNIQTGLLELTREVLNSPKATLHSNLLNLGMDSMQGLKLANRVREKFGRALPLTLFMRAKTLTDLAKAIEDLLQKSDDPSAIPEKTTPAKAKPKNSTPTPVQPQESQDDPALLQLVCNEVAAILRREPAEITPSNSFTSLGMGSLEQMRLMNRLRQHFGKKIPMRILQKQEDLRVFAQYLAPHT